MMIKSVIIFTLFLWFFDHRTIYDDRNTASMNEEVVSYHTIGQIGSGYDTISIYRLADPVSPNLDKLGGRVDRPLAHNIILFPAGSYHRQI